MNEVLAVVLAGGTGDRLSILSEERAKPAVVFGGRYRIIDFTLSNCVYAGIQKVAVLTQYEPRSLNQHLGIGKPWDLDRMGGGIFLLQPYRGRRSSEWYKNTADAVYQNLYFVEESNANRVLVLAGDHIYRMAYKEMAAFHQEVQADCTVGVLRVPMEEAYRYGVLTVGPGGEIAGFEEKPAHPGSDLVSMGIYLFDRETLIQELTADALSGSSTHDFGRDVIPSMVGRRRVFAFRFDGYWRDVGTVQSYWEANMDLVVDLPQLNLYDAQYPVLTRDEARPPAKTGPRALVTRSLVCDGCVVNGSVIHSVLSPGVYVEEGAVVEDSIVFHDTFVARGARVRMAILDKQVRVGEGARIGYGEDNTPNELEPSNLYTGITIVGKGAHIPAGVTIGRNCRIDPHATPAAFHSDTVPSGKTIADGRRLSLRRR